MQAGCQILLAGEMAGREANEGVGRFKECECLEKNM
jgi:hypothetical protein